MNEPRVVVDDSASGAWAAVHVQGPHGTLEKCGNVSRGVGGKWGAYPVHESASWDYPSKQAAVDALVEGWKRRQKRREQRKAREGQR